MTQTACELPLESDGAAGSGGQGITIGVNVSVGVSESTSASSGGAEGGSDGSSVSSGAGAGSTSSGAGASGSGGAGSTSSAGGEGAGTSSTGGTGGEGSGAGPTGGTGGEGSGAGPTGGTGGEGSGAGPTGGTGGAGPGSGGAGGAGGAPGSTSGAGGAPGSGGAGGGIEVPTACPGEPHTLHAGEAIEIVGDLEGALNLLDTCWAEEDGGERVYDLTIAESGTLSLEVVEAGDLDAALVLLDACGVLDPQRCYNFSSDGERVAFHTEPGMISAVIEAMGGVDGGFTFTATLTKATCGDAVLNPGEACDVGPGIPDDGCGDPGTAEECQVIATTSSTDVCPGEPVAVPVGATMLAMDTHTTLGFVDDYSGSCMPSGGGPDRVFAATPAASGTLTVKVGFDVDGVTSWCAQDFTNPACFDVEMYVRSSCESADVEDEVACSSTCCDGETLSFPVTAGEPVYVFVDGYDAEFYSSGPFNLHFELVPN